MKAKGQSGWGEPHQRSTATAMSGSAPGTARSTRPASPTTTAIRPYSSRPPSGSCSFSLRPRGPRTMPKTRTCPPRRRCCRTARCSWPESRECHLLNGTHLGGIGGEEASLRSPCGGDIDGGDAVVGDVVYLPCLSGTEAVQVTADPGAPDPVEFTAGGRPAHHRRRSHLVHRTNGTLYGLDRASRCGASASLDRRPSESLSDPERRWRAPAGPRRHSSGCLPCPEPSPHPSLREQHLTRSHRGGSNLGLASAQGGRRLTSRRLDTKVGETAAATSNTPPTMM